MRIHTVSGGLLGTNCYLVWEEGNDDCVAIDPGFSSGEILAVIRAQGKNLQAVLLTHGHFDHVGGARGLQEATGCKVYIHPADLGLPGYLTQGEIPATDYYEKTLSIAGLNMQVLHTPGHTPGSVCLIAGDSIFSGDTLFAGSCGRTDFPGGSWSQILASLLRLSKLEGDLQVLSGHGEASHLEAERKYNPYMKEATKR